MKQSLLLGVALVLLAGCGSDSLKRENIEPPKELVEFTPSVSVERLWARGVGDGVKLTGARLEPAVAGNRVFAASVDGQLVALEAGRGQQIWRAENATGYAGGPAADDDLVVVGTLEGEVIAYDAERGTERWRTQVSSEVISAPALARDRVIVLANDGRVYALARADGKSMWTLDQGVPSLTLRGNSSPLVAGEDVFLAYANGRVRCVALADGKPRWEQSIGTAEGRTEIDRMVDIDGRFAYERGDLFLAGFDSSAVALTGDAGRTLWTRDLSSVAGLVVAGNAVYVTATDGEIWALDRRSGASLWKNEQLMYRQLSAPAVQGSFVVVGDLEGYLHWLSIDEGKLAARSRLGDQGFAQGPVVAGEVLYAQSRDGELAAYRIDG